MNKFWNWKVKNSEEDENEIFFDGAIASESWWGDEITPSAFKEELRQHPGDVTVWINSPGGECFAASQIYTMLKEHNGRITVKIDGIAASAASVVAMAGDEISIAPTGMIMIHNPATMAYGDHAEMEKTQRMLDEVKDSIINAYELKTGLARDEISQMMEDETWMNANKALELGFVDSILYAEKKNPQPQPTEPTEPVEPEPKEPVTTENKKSTGTHSVKSMAFGVNSARKKCIDKYTKSEETGRKVSDLVNELYKKKYHNI